MVRRGRAARLSESFAGDTVLEALADQAAQLGVSIIEHSAAMIAATGVFRRAFSASA